jgi:predicted ATPase
MNRVILENWKNFTHTDTQLENRVFLIGPNASGKSNFLDVFRFVQDIVAVGGGFQEAVRRRGGIKAIRALSARRYSDITIDLHVKSEGDGDSWQYRLRFTQDNRQRALIRNERVIRNGTDILLDRPNEDDQQDSERLTQTHLEQVNMNRQFRDLTEFFSTIRYLHIVPQLVRDPDRSIGRKNDPFGGDFLEQLARTPEKTRKARLRRIDEALKLAVPQLSDLKLDRDERGVPHLRAKYEHWRPQGYWQTETQFSDGTLRLLGLLWALLDGGGPLLLEEPEMSLHPEIVRYIPTLFRNIQRHTGRQIIISTHSPEILHDEGIGLDEVLLLRPEKEGTVVEAASTIKEVDLLLKDGLSLAEIVMPRTRPQRISQLTIFDFA